MVEKGNWYMRKRNLALFFLLLAVLTSACLFSSGYLKKDGTYKYATSDEAHGYVEHPIPDIDVQSFQILNKNGYAKDKLHVYYHVEFVQGADPDSFVTLSEYYGKDKSHVYYEWNLIPGADPQSFKLFDIQWGRDSQDVFLQSTPIHACDPSTFVLLKERWQRDSQCAYRQGNKLPAVDAASFVVLNFWFAKDKSHVYTTSAKILEGADASTFKAKVGACEVCGQDTNSCYRFDQPVDCKSLK
jgi:hypothetical protein